MKKISELFHNRFVYSRRMDRLAEILFPLLEKSKDVLDVGCGDGKIDSYILNHYKDLRIRGIDVLVRSKTYIPVQEYDGAKIPYEDETFDTVMAVDVLHHTDNPASILKEMTRVSSKYIILKDHVKGGIISYIKLRMMDYVGNAHYNVRLPYNYQTLKQWKKMFSECGLEEVEYKKELALYKGILHLLFDRDLHFVTLLRKTNI